MKVHVCPPIIRYCKRGHLRTKETTFERRYRYKDKVYISRECRICHSLRNSGKPKYGPNSTSKWKRFVAKQEKAQ